MYQETITQGTRQAVITGNTAAGPFSTRLYVDNGNVATLTVKRAKTIAGARKQAAQMLTR